MKFVNYVKAHKGLTFIIAFFAVIAIVAVSVYGSINSTRKTTVNMENSLVTQYKDNQNELSNYILTFNETLGIADRQSNKLNDILLEAVKGRYGDDANGVDPTGGTMFSAITEAYPDLTATSEMYAKVQDVVISGRVTYKNKQALLLDLIRTYNDWRNDDLFRSFLLNSIIGAPTDNLTVTDAGNTYTGEAALKQISDIVLTQDAVDAYESGTQDPLITPEDSEE